MLQSQIANKILLITLITESLILPKTSLSNSYNGTIDQPQYLSLEANWCLKNRDCLDLEVAKTLEEQEKGMMYRPPMPRGRGMWFPMASPRQVYFWMYKTLAPMDMIFIYQEEVVYIANSVPTCNTLPCPLYGPHFPVDGVVELRAGETKRLGIGIGYEVKIRYFSSDSAK